MTEKQFDPHHQFDRPIDSEREPSPSQQQKSREETTRLMQGHQLYKNVAANAQGSSKGEPSA